MEVLVWFVLCELIMFGAPAMPADMTLIIAITAAALAPVLTNQAISRGLTGSDPFFNAFIFAIAMALIPIECLRLLQNLDAAFASSSAIIAETATITIIVITPVSVYAMPLIRVVSRR